MRTYKVFTYTILLVGLFLVGCTEKVFVSVPDSYNDQGKELIYVKSIIKAMNNIFTKYKMESINNFYTQSILWCKNNEYI